MKRILLLIISIFFFGWAYASNTLQLSSAQAHPGDTVTLTLTMNNSDAVVALQTMIPLCGQLTYVPGSCVLTARGSSHYVSATVLRDTLRIYSYSLSLTPYSGNSGDLLSFQLILKKEPATYTLPLCSTLLSSATGASLSVSTSAGAVTILAPKIALSTSSINYGHIPIRSNYTQNVTVRNTGNEPLNLNGVSFNNNTLSTNNGVQTIAAGGQSMLTIQYAPVAAGAITYQAVFHSNARVGDSILTILADPFAVNELRPLSTSGETDSIVTVSLRMNNMDSIVGLQTSIILPAALTYVSGSFEVSAARSQGHVASAGMRGDTLVMLITSMENRPLRDGDGVVATFQLRLHGYGYYSLNLIKTTLSSMVGRNVLSAVYSGGVQIYSPSINCANTMNMGTTPVTEFVQQSFAVRNNGNATMVIHQVVFTNSDFSLVTQLPITISAWQNSALEVEYHGTQEGTHSGIMAIYSNDPFNPMKQVSLTAERYEPNYLTISGDENQNIENAAIDIELDNYSAITALQMDVEYPYQHYAMEISDIHLTERSNGHVVSAARQNDSTFRVLILSLQNQPFIGHEGSVAHIQLHSIDPTDGQPYPLYLRNVLSGGPDGVDRLRSYDNMVYIATNILHDTTYIPVHDTTYIDVHDTTYVDVPYPVHDTTYVDIFVPVHDTTYIDIHDTTYVDVPYAVHDTTYVDVFVPVHDTTYIDVHDTTYVDVPYPVHDTTYVDVFVPVHDTTYIDVHDTTYVDVPYPVHDTTYVDVPYPVHDTTYVDIFVPVHDTTYIDVHDTTYVDVPYPVHDTTYITLHDTITITEQLTWYTLQVTSDDITRGVAAGSGDFPEGTTVEIAAVPFEGNRFQQWSDGSQDNPRSVQVNQDIMLTAQFTTVGVENISQPQWQVFSDGEQIVLKGVENKQVRIYDSIGKLLWSYANAPFVLRYTAPAAGVYIIQVDGGSARKVVVSW